MRLQQLSKEVIQINNYKVLETSFKNKLAYYEQVIETLTAENTEFILQIDSIDELEESNQALKDQLKEVQKDNQQLMAQIEKLKSDVKTQKALRDDFKCFVQQNMDVFDVKEDVDFGVQSEFITTGQ